MSLEELHLSLNDYSSSGGGQPSEGSATFPGLHRLFLSECSLDSWPALRRILACFPCLEDLIAADNPGLSLLGSAGEEGAAELAALLPCLRLLSCNGWSISEWSQVERIAALPLLTDFRLNNVPLLARLPENEGRIHAVARLPGVLTYNCSNVTEQEREYAERSFIRAFLHLPPSQRPPRVQQLERVHGQLEPLADIRWQTSHTATVRLVFANRLESRELLLTQTLGQLKRALQPFCQLPPSRFRLYLHSQTTIDFLGREELKLPNLALQAFNIRDNDLLEIVEKPESALPARRRTSSSASSAGSVQSPLK